MASWLPWVRARRANWRSTPLTEEQRDHLRRNVPMLRHLTPAVGERFEGLVQIFLHEKSFEGLGGLDLTEEMKLTIAGQACFLLVGLDEVDVPYPGLDVIRVYPRSFKQLSGHADPFGTYRPPAGTVIGESSRRGYVVLAWDSVVRGGCTPHDADNVVLHEFAHQLDTQDGVADGAPVLPEGRMYGPWARILGQVYDQLRHELAEGRSDVLRAYGATNPAEFFAVATETFFEKPRRLQREHPGLYDMMREYYRQDPAEWERDQP
ncbi:MAG: M90 family metallopeptidase [Myxococcota bacterium]